MKSLAEIIYEADVEKALNANVETPFGRRESEEEGSEHSKGIKLYSNVIVPFKDIPKQLQNSYIKLEDDWFERLGIQ